MRTRIRVRYTATMDPMTIHQLDHARGPLNRSAMVEIAVQAWLELLENVKAMKERYDNASKTRRIPATQ